jgi:hypothetical protein
MQVILKSLFFLILSIQIVHADINGRWKLTISGEDYLEFGTENLAGGLVINWLSNLEFTIRHGLFVQGTGTARLLPGIVGTSRPEDMFDCAQVSGTFANNSGQSFSTPHLRYRSFPMLGKVVDDSIRLNPHLEYPGNYYAVLYECKTRNSLGSFWLEQSPRIARELSKRQNALVDVTEAVYSANIKEVKTIAPGPEMEMPLVDGLSFSVTQEYGLRKLEYRLKKISSH